MSSRTYRKTRFVCVSDTHNASPATGAFKLPKGDVLIHAGDMTKEGTHAELRRTLDWIENTDFEAKIVVAGNHDRALDKDFYVSDIAILGNKGPNDPEACIRMFEDSSATYLNHESKTIKLEEENGPKTAFTVFGSPYSPMKDLWAFGYKPEAAQALWDQIPLDVDLLITHTPPKNHCDESKSHAHAGCEYLFQALWRVRPRLAVCGHIHDGRGAERVVWDVSSTNTQQGYTTGRWLDAASGTKKQSLIILNSGAPKPLENGMLNDTNWVWQSPESTQRSDNYQRKEDQRSSSDRASLTTSGVLNPYDIKSTTNGDSVVSKHDGLERKETGIINASIMASSWPYKGYNKPIVVDINLPTRERLP